jgi:hypothetical protein
VYSPAKPARGRKNKNGNGNYEKPKHEKAGTDRKRKTDRGRYNDQLRVL